MKDIIENILKQKGPLDSWEIVAAIAEKRGSANGSDVLDELEFGPFVQDDSGRWHLESQR